MIEGIGWMLLFSFLVSLSIRVPQFLYATWKHFSNGVAVGWGVSKHNNAGVEALIQGHYVEAERELKAAIKIAEGLDWEFPALAKSLDNLAYVFHCQMRYKEAEPIFNRALAIFEKTLGPEHVDLATNLNNLAINYYTQGRYKEAEPLFQRALFIFKKILGPDHPAIILQMTNMVDFYENFGKPQYAADFFAQANEMEERLAVQK